MDIRDLAKKNEEPETNEAFFDDTMKQLDKQLDLIKKKAKKDGSYATTASAELRKIVNKLSDIKSMK